MTRRAALALTAAVALVAFTAEEAGAVAPAGEYSGPSTGATAPTAEKPESKLWFTDGAWWSVMITAATGDHKIYRLNPETQAWSDTGVVVDTRNNTHVDALFSGSKLYVASHVFSESGTSGNPSRLYRFSYNASTDRYTLDGGFPQQINDRSSETLVIAKDSVGRLWATWTQQSAVWVNRTTNVDTTWGTPFALPGGGGLLADDISSVIAYGGNRIGIMWSDQNGDESFKFVSRADSTTSPSFSAVEAAITGALIADDHINLKTDSSGRIFAATKTSKEGSSDPQVLLLIRGAGGGWTSRTFGRVADDHTRPIVLIYERQENSRLFIFATVSDPRDIYFKETSLDNPSFPTGLGTPAIDDATVNDATSTKGNLTDATDLLVQASGSSYRHYWRPLGK